MHCRLELVNGQLIVEDLGSTNGTFIDDEPVTRAKLRMARRCGLGRSSFGCRVQSRTWRRRSRRRLSRAGAAPSRLRESSQVSSRWTCTECDATLCGGCVRWSHWRGASLSLCAAVAAGCARSGVKGRRQSGRAMVGG